MSKAKGANPKMQKRKTSTPTRTHKPKSTRAKATTRSTAGVGFDFEDQVSAWLLAKSLRGNPIPGIAAQGVQLQTQTHALGWVIDDLLVTGIAPSGERRQLAISCKSNPQVTSTGLPSDFVALAWQQWRQEAPISKKGDGLALVTRGRNNAFETAWADIKLWSDDDEASLAAARMRATAKHRRIFESIKTLGTSRGLTASDDEVVALIRRLHVLPLDFQLPDSEAEQAAVNGCREILQSGNQDDGRNLWNYLVERARSARLGNGSVRIGDLWEELRKKFDLKDHPNIAGSWETLTRLTDECRVGVQTSLPTGSSVLRMGLADKLSKSIAANAVNVIYGDSGTGKSALVKWTLDTSMPDWSQVWLGPEQLEYVLTEIGRKKINLARPIPEILQGLATPRVILVIDAVERLPPDTLERARQLVSDLVARKTEEFPDCRVVIIGQTEAWVANRLQTLSGMLLPPNLEVAEIDAEQVIAALRNSKSLRWLGSYPEAVVALTNLRTLAWVMEADTLFQKQSEANALSYTAIADRLWLYWTESRVTLQRLLVRLAEREASFERSFAISELEAGDVAAFEAYPSRLPLRRTARNRIEFEHDLAADWARFQRLKEIAHDVSQWTALAVNPLWNRSLRMLGQFLLRERVDSSTAWDKAFEAIEREKKEARLGTDVLLDALCLDPFAESFLSDRADLLFDDHGKNLNRLLRRFEHIATVPGISPSLEVDASVRFYLEANYRTPVYGRWPAVAKFLAAHRERVAALTSPVVARVCEIWLTTTPLEIQPGVAMPFRIQFAETAITSARQLQIEQGKRTIFLDQAEEHIYAAAFSAALDLPDQVGEWALEMANRRKQRKDISTSIANFHRKESEKYSERMRTDASFRQQMEARRSLPVSISPRKLPPWPLGPRGRVESGFRHCCLHSQSLASLMKARPAIASEVLLATIIDDSPQESESSSSRYDQDYGLEFDQESYPTAYWHSPFFQFLQIDQVEALTTLIRLVNFCTERWAGNNGRRRGQSPGVAIRLEDGNDRFFVGNHIVFNWSQEDSLGTGQLNSALAALERWATIQLDRDQDIEILIRQVFEQSNSVAILGVLVNLGKYRPKLFAGSLRPLLTIRELYEWDHYRVRNLHFDAMNWVRKGERIFELAKQWALAPHRNEALLTIARKELRSDEKVAEFVLDATSKWQFPSSGKEWLEARILVAQLDARNYVTNNEREGGEEVVGVRFPADLLQDIAAYEAEVQPHRRAILLPYQCEQLLRQAELLTADQASTLSQFLEPHDAQDRDEMAEQSGKVAVASVLLVKAPQWLNERPAIFQKCSRIIEEVVSGIGSAPGEMRELTSRKDLQFAAYAVFYAWLGDTEHAGETEERVLRLLTSGDGVATATLVNLGHAHRVELRSRWWRLLYLGLLWSGLSILVPRYDDPGTLGQSWSQWLGRLRKLKIGGVSAGPDAIRPLQIALRIERLERARWRRAYAREDYRSHRAPEERHSPGLNTATLKDVFGWLLAEETGGEQGALGEENRALVQALWEFESWRKYRDIDEDGTHGTPSEFGYDLVAALARMTLGAPEERAAELWRPLFSLGPNAHYAIGHFIDCWFIQISPRLGVATFARRWREMLLFVFDAPTWTSARKWYQVELLLRKLLGFGFADAMIRAPGFDVVVADLRPFYQRWGREHLGRDEDNVADFCGFLASSAGKVLRAEGAQWLSAVLHGDTSAARWRQKRTGNALVEALDAMLAQEGGAAAVDATFRGALISIVSHLVVRQVPMALALQERVQQLR
jgi:hypothetical protein